LTVTMPANLTCIGGEHLCQYSPSLSGRFLTY
jgi:hypothetical protein